MARAGRRAAKTEAGASPYRAALDGLYRRRRFGLRPGLEVIRALLAELGSPERGRPTVHVAGSKGKGSVSAMVASILAETGLRTGLYTSPHLVSYRERIRVDGEAISKGEVVDGLAEVDAAAARLLRRAAIAHEPTFFEATTALAFRQFARKHVGAAAVEVGLGGEFDATNVLDGPVGVIGTIEYEHTDILGPELTDVARAKAGILHRGMRAVLGEPKPEPRRTIEERADREGVPLWRLGREVELGERDLEEEHQTFTVRTPHRDHPDLRLPLRGAFQARNAALAVAAVDLFAEARGVEVPESAVRAGLAGVRWRARLERVERGPDLYLDVAHTPESARAVAEGLGEDRPDLDPEENVLVFGCLSGKRVPEMLEPLSTLARTIVVVPVRSERSAPVDELRRAALGRFPRILLAPGALDGLALARAATGDDGFTLVTGSDYLAGEVLRAREGGAEEEPDLSDPGVVPRTDGASR